MADPPREDVTQLLQHLNAGESSANDRLMDAVYDQLRAMAHSHMNREFGRGQPGATLQPTALVNETYLKLIKQRQQYDSRGQFFAIATKLMIRVLLDYQRQRKAAKRGGGWVQVPLDIDEGKGPAPDDGSKVEALVGALDALEKLDSRKADVVKLRVLWGLKIDEIATTLGGGRATVDRDWQFAKAWLKKEIGAGKS